MLQATYNRLLTVIRRVLTVAQQVTNSTSIHEGAGSIPGLGTCTCHECAPPQKSPKNLKVHLWLDYEKGMNIKMSSASKRPHQNIIYQELHQSK